jgi:hypothetical protein
MALKEDFYSTRISMTAAANGAERFRLNRFWREWILGESGEDCDVMSKSCENRTVV